MPQALVWSRNADATIIAMRGKGATWAQIGSTLGLSRNTVIERGRRLNAQAPARVAAAPVEKLITDDPHRGPLPAGHPLTWGLLTSEPFPRDDAK